MESPVRPQARSYATGLLLAALLAGNAALALGPWFVRLADSGPVAAGFWRLLLALPVLWWLARREEAAAAPMARATAWAIAAAGVLFALDLAAWHVGIELTRLGNAALFGNSGSLVLMAWGFAVARAWPRARDWSVIAMALAGVAILLGRSFEISADNLVGDLFCLVAGLLYAGYLLILQRARGTLGSWGLLYRTGLAGIPVLLTNRATARRARMARRLDPAGGARAVEPAGRPGVAGLCAAPLSAAGDRAGAADPAGDRRARRMAGFRRDGERARHGGDGAAGRGAGLRAAMRAVGPPPLRLGGKPPSLAPLPQAGGGEARLTPSRLREGR